MADERAPDLFLIDGNSIAYRAFFALPETIATSRGFPTNAIFGFASMLVKLLQEYGQRPVVVVWDGGMSGREQVSVEYKAQRRERPDLLAEQWPHLHPLVEAFGYTNVKVAGYEADDVIATLAGQARDEGIDVMVVTGDRDMFQIVEPGVRVMATARGITDTKIYDRQAVIDRYGIPPELIPDLYGLKGDTSDNIPGVPGIGDKTASQLLQQFGTLERVLESVDQISGAKRKQNLTEHAENARMSKALATAIRDIPDVGVDLTDCVARPVDRSRLRETFREFELRDPLRRLEEALGDGDAAAPAERTETVLTARAVEIAAPDLAGMTGAAASGDGAAVALAAVRPRDEEGRVAGPVRFAAHSGGEEVLVGEAETLAALALSWGERPVVAHDWKSLATQDDALGQDDGPRGDWDAPPLAHDTQVAAYLIDPARRRYPLDELATDAGLSAQVEGADGVAEAALLTHAIAERQRGELSERGLERLFHDVELPLVDVLIAMERIGLLVDPVRLGEIRAGFETRMNQLEREIYEDAGEEFTIGSPQQLGVVLFEKLGLSKKRRGKTGFSTDARVLQAIRDEHPIVAKVEAWRELSKLMSTYLDALPELIDPRDGRIHTTFNQTTTTTGRLSSVNPNLQNIPIRTDVGREIRACFVAPPGWKLLSADYSQVELRVLAHIAGEDVLKGIFERGEDVHTATTAEMFDIPLDRVDKRERDRAKMINYGIVYGLSAFGLADRLGIAQEEAQEFIDRYLGRFPKVREFISGTIEFAKEKGYVQTMFGRTRRIPELRARQWATRSLGERLAVNTVIQGSAADIIKVAMVRCHTALAEANLATRLVLQIHDELLFEAPEEELAAAEEIVRREMTAAYRLDPPLAVDVGTGENWLVAK